MVDLDQIKQTKQFHFIFNVTKWIFFSVLNATWIKRCWLVWMQLTGIPRSYAIGILSNQPYSIQWWLKIIYLILCMKAQNWASVNRLWYDFTANKSNHKWAKRQSGFLTNDQKCVSIMTKTATTTITKWQSIKW